MRVVDLGSAPGSWLQYAAERVGPRGVVVGVDVTKITIPLPGTVHLLEEDIFRLDPARLLEHATAFDVLLSDAAPKTTGVPFADQARSIELGRTALSLASAVVRRGGAFVCKVFQGEDLPSFRGEAKARFRRFYEVKPKSSRSGSVEIFLVGLGMEKE
jgi:23S rRNA (uridine2552-2'-O)-methyltransferase